MKTKLCTHKDHAGDRELPLSAFSKHPGTKDGRQSICKDCNKRLAYARAARMAEERRRAKGQEPLAAYRDAERRMVYREPPMDYREGTSPDVLLKDL